MNFPLKGLRVVSTLALIFIFITSVGMAIPQKINFQGKLTDSAGDPVTGSKSIVFTIYDASSGGTDLWNETRTVPVLNGIYNLNLGDGTEIPASVFGGSERWLGIKVESDSEMVPRMKIVSVGNAYTAIAANYATLSGTTSRCVVNTTQVSLTNGANNNVNIGTYSYIRLASGETLAYNISGFSGDNVDGKVIYVSGTNTASPVFTMLNESTASTITNRIQTNTGLTLTAASAGGFTAVLVYDASAGTGTLGRWRVVSWLP